MVSQLGAVGRVCTSLKLAVLIRKPPIENPPPFLPSTILATTLNPNHPFYISSIWLSNWPMGSLPYRLFGELYLEDPI